MAMSKKDFVAIAKAIKDARETYGRDGIVSEYTAKAIAAHCATTNPAFNRARFLTACGVEE